MLGPAFRCRLHLRCPEERSQESSCPDEKKLPPNHANVADSLFGIVAWKLTASFTSPRPTQVAARGSPEQPMKRVTDRKVRRDTAAAMGKWPRSGDIAMLSPSSKLLRERPQQSSAHHEYIRQTTGHLQPMQVLRQSPIANLGKLEKLLDHPEGMLDAGADVRLVPVFACSTSSIRSCRR